MELGQDCGACLGAGTCGHGEGRPSPEEQAALDRAIAESWEPPSPPCRTNAGPATPRLGMLNFGESPIDQFGELALALGHRW
jgi:hypothetical protein